MPPKTRCAYKKCNAIITNSSKFGVARKYCDGKCKQNHYYATDPAKISAKRQEHYLKRKATLAALSSEERARYDAMQAIKRKERYIMDNELLRARASDYYHANKKKILAKMKQQRQERKRSDNV